MRQTIAKWFILSMVSFLLSAAVVGIGAVIAYLVDVLTVIGVGVIVFAIMLFFVSLLMGMWEE